jgi:hypothetical protein
MSLDLYRGDSYQWRFVLWADPAKTQPFDVTGSTVKSEIRSAPGGKLVTTLVATVTAPNIIIATLPAVNSGLLTEAGGAWDLQVTLSTGEVLTVLKGPVTVTMDVTDSAATASSSETTPTQPARFGSRPAV